MRPAAVGSRRRVTGAADDRRPRARVLAYVGVLILLTFGLAEGICRVAEPRSDALIGPFEIDVDPELVGFEPGQEVGHLGLSTHANPGGYTGAFYPRRRRPGTFRVAALGDSFTFGWGVQADRAWPALLEAALDEALAPQGIDAEVLNFGVPGYNTYLERVQWERQAASYHPDAVLLGYYSNDAVIDRRVPNVYRACPLPPPRLPALMAALQERSALARVLHDLYWIAVGGSPLAPWEGKDVLVPGGYGFRCSVLWASELAGEVAEAGAAFSVVQLPHLADIDRPDDPEGPAQRRLHDALEAAGLRSDDLYPRLAGGSPQALNNADLHPNEAGHRAILRALWPTTGRWLLGLAESSPPGSPSP